MAKKKNEPLLLRGAAGMMEDLFLSGKYFDLKRAEKKEEVLKPMIIDRFKARDDKRIEIGNFIYKYQRVGIYEWDKAGLNDYLNDHGVLVPVVSFNKSISKNEDVYPLIQSFQRDKGEHIRFYPNKKGRLVEEPDIINSLFVEELIESFEANRKVFLQAAKHVNSAKKQMRECHILKEKKSLKSNFGTVKRMPNNPSWDTESLFHELGDEAIEIMIEHGSVSKEDLDQLIALKIIDRKEVESFRTQVDIQTRFMLMDKESEQRQWDMLQKRKFELAELFKNAG